MVLKERIINSFNSGAYTYDDAADIQRIVARRLAERLAGVSAHTILEIGCGTGLFSQYLPQFFPYAEVLLTDLVPAMTTICQDRFAGNANISVACMDGETLAIPSVFDLIVSSMTLHWFSDINKSLSRIITKLAPGGRLLFAMLGSNSLSEWREICQSCHVSVPTPVFPSAHSLQQQFPNLECHIEITKQHYRNAHDFLKKMKSIGASTPHANHDSFSSGVLRRVMRAFDEKYADNMHISYEIIYGSYINA